MMDERKGNSQNPVSEQFYKPDWVTWVLLLLLVGLLLFAGLGNQFAAGQTQDPIAEQPAELVVANSTESEAVSADDATTDTSGDLTFTLPNIPVAKRPSFSPRFDPVTFRGKKPEHTLKTYTVVRGDTPISIAEKFGINAETILGGNPRLSQESNLLQTGDDLIIMPINGVLYDVQSGDTLESISEKYSIPVEDIIAYEPNNLEFPYRLYPDSQVIVPNAVREVFVWEPPKIASIVRSNTYWASQAEPIFIGTGTFIWPVDGRRITQTHWYGHKAIDVGVPTGSPVYASDSGTVVYSAWSPYCYGNLIVINHGNGFETFYAHLDSFNVVAGQIIYQGSVIGRSGNTGCSSGPHIHFEVRYYSRQDSPFFWLP